MPPTLLIVEDEFFVRVTTADFLRDAGYEVVEAGNADEALEIFKSGAAIDLLFTDVRMPGSMDGCELARRVRLDWPSVRVIVTSGYSESLLAARSACEDLVLPKPYRPQAVLTQVRAMIGADISPN